MFQEPTIKRKEVKYMIVDDCWTENLDLVLFMIISSLDFKDEFDVALQIENLRSCLASQREGSFCAAADYQ
jgi:hypothetical protein